MASIIEVAKRAGVSQATVSRVLNNYPNVSKTAEVKVKQAMEDLGYRPAARRQGHRSGLQYGTFALLILDYDVYQHYSPAFVKLLTSVESACTEQGLNIIIAQSLDAQQLPPLVQNKQVDGLILAGQSAAPAVLKKIASLPAVWVSSHHEDSGDTALPGNDAAGRLAAQYLLNRGHKHLAVVNALPNHLGLQSRTEFFEFTAQRNNATVAAINAPVENLTTLDDLDLNAIEAAMTVAVDKLLAQKNKPTGFFTLIDIFTAIMHRILIRKGLKPGKDIDLIGCNNNKAALAGLYPRPATIRIGIDTMGKRAVEQLLWRISNPNEKENVHVVVEPQLIPGD
ncbi:LacI family DNA-binding transcriptional regulator [Poriferisphaera sp. WC338]|uniref:LacI family DNA-binding transcriptional regulator n=1 Tax=Poriferisphaera sp. WC338 TaxID=3425129 RepID=UPI003D812663